MDENNRVSLLALIVALLALVIALGQLIQQIFGTADGYRRCQSSVIGPWAKYTKLRWRWSQFRFETKFATPDIRLKDARLGEGYYDLFASESHVHDRSLPGSESETESAVSWGRFLLEVRAKEQWKAKAIRGSERWERYCVTAKVDRSWDLMPPDMVLPLASSRLGDVVVLAHRLGMRWLEIGYKELLAEGSGQVLSSTELRGLGLVLKYDRVGKMIAYEEYIPSVAVDKLRCGILPAMYYPCFDDFRQDLRLIGEDRLPSLLIDHMAWITEEAYDLLRKSRQDILRRFPHSINDWISMNCEFLPMPNWPYRHIVWPIALNGLRSMLMSPQSWSLLAESLQQMVGDGDVGARLVTERNDPRFQPLKKSLSELLQDVIEASYRAKPGVQLESTKVQIIREIFEQTTSVYQSLPRHATGRGIRGRNPYRVLVDCHLSLGIECTDEAYEDRTSYEPPVSIEGDFRHSYFRYKLLQICIERRHRIVEHFIRVGGNAAMDLSSGQIEALWWVLMLRSVCWWASIEVVCPTSNIPSEYYYSQLPIYLM